MSSWFNVESLKDLAREAVAHTVGEVDLIDVKGLTEHVTAAARDLTLTSPELLEERRRIDDEERAKERAKFALAGMMPWETRDPERDILVEECKEAVLKLSSCKETFTGPYHLPKPDVNLESDKKKKTTNADNGDTDDEGDDAGSGDDDDDEAEDEQEQGDNAALLGGEDTSIISKSEMPSEESLEKLKTLEPLPPLLQNFDFDSHVGLIQALLKEDPQLVRMQSKLSGGGEHEKVFWRNYFFHVAWCRYEAGLSIDEVWSDTNRPPTNDPTSSSATGLGDQSERSNGAGSVTGGSAHDEQTITFERESEESATDKAFPAEPTTDVDAPFRTSGTTTTATALGTSSQRGSDSSSPDFEMVGHGSQSDENNNAAAEDGDDGVVSGEPVDYELDELEAEIARELED